MEDRVQGEMRSGQLVRSRSMSPVSTWVRTACPHILVTPSLFFLTPLPFLTHLPCFPCLLSSLPSSSFFSLLPIPFLSSIPSTPFYLFPFFSSSSHLLLYLHHPLSSFFLYHSLLFPFFALLSFSSSLLPFIFSPLSSSLFLFLPISSFRLNFPFFFLYQVV